MQDQYIRQLFMVTFQLKKKIVFCLLHRTYTYTQTILKVTLSWNYILKYENCVLPSIKLLKQKIELIK